jgi:hypothetical protein
MQRQLPTTEVVGEVTSLLGVRLLFNE